MWASQDAQRVGDTERRRGCGGGEGCSAGFLGARWTGVAGRDGDDGSSSC
jgi:hypothetical protein